MFEASDARLRTVMETVREVVHDNWDCSAARDLAADLEIGPPVRSFRATVNVDFEIEFCEVMESEEELRDLLEGLEFGFFRIGLKSGEEVFVDLETVQSVEIEEL